MSLQAKIQELAARFALDLVTAFREATLEEIADVARGGDADSEMPEVEEIAKKKAGDYIVTLAKPKRPRRRLRSWRRMRRFRK